MNFPEDLFLPDTAMRAPDVSFLLHETLKRLKPSEKEGFYKTCPDFVIELKSKSDSLKTLQHKLKSTLKTAAPRAG